MNKQTNKCSLIVLGLALSVAIAGCSRIDEPDSPVVPVNERFTETESKVLSYLGDTRVGVNEAVEQAMQATTLFGGPATRSGAKIIANMTPLTLTQTVPTKSGETVESVDTLAYLFNFADEGGFTIIAADSRIPQSVLAYSENGNITDQTDNAGLAIFMEGLEYYLQRSVAEADHLKDSLEASVMAKLYEEMEENGTPVTRAAKTETTTTVTYGGWEQQILVDQRIPVEWGQHDPYNMYTPNNYPTGCVAVAMVHLMAYYKHPKSCPYSAFDWETLNLYTGQTAWNRYKPAKKCILFDTSPSEYPQNVWIRKQVAYAMKYAGDLVGMNYAPKVSLAPTKNLHTIFRNLGYIAPSGEISYNVDEIFNSIRQYKPVIISGYATKEKSFLGIETHYKDGHTWILDGSMVQKRKKTTTVRVIDTQTRIVLSSTSSYVYEYSDFIYNNWGYGGKHNGWIVSGSFNMNDGPELDRDDYAENFRYNIKIIPYIYKP